MPSIRVRRGTSYSSLNEDPRPYLPSPRSLTNIFNTQTGSPARRPQTRPSLPVLRGGERAPQLRPRSNTGLSRVQSHILRDSVQDARALTYHGRESERAADLEYPQSPYRQSGSPQMDATPLRQSGRVSSSIKAHPWHEEEDWDEHHHDDIVEHLDAIDPQVSMVSTLTNAANSIVIPPTPLYDRKPVINLLVRPQEDRETGSLYDNALDRHVDDVIKRPSPIRRTLQGIWAFLKTPVGIITGIYGFLVVFWGAAIVIFLARIINFHNDDLQGFWVEIASQVENGLFTLTSIGLIPSRIFDTYRIYKIWQYKRKTIRLRKLAGLPQLFDLDDLPDPFYDDKYVRVLSDKEQQDLHRQQVKFQYHQTWYRAHGSETHRAFPINIALAICFLNDGNSIFQIILCGTMWGLNRFQRPAWSTGTLIPASFLCGIGAAILIWRGGERTKRVEEVRQRLRDALLQTLQPLNDSPRSPSQVRYSQEDSHRMPGIPEMETANPSTENLTSGNDELVHYGSK